MQESGLKHLQKSQEYAQKKEISKLFEGIVSELIINKPSDPIQFMIDYLERPTGSSSLIPVHNIVVVGPPSSGCKLIAQKIAEISGSVLLSSGELIRKAIENGTQNGADAYPYVVKNQLVPDSVVNEIFATAVDETRDSGHVFEGYPMTIEQLKYMQLHGWNPEETIFVNMDESVVISQVSSCKLDPKTGKLYLPNEIEGLDSEIRQRLSDKEFYSKDAVQQRTQKYSKSILSVKNNVSNARHVYLEKILTNLADAGRLLESLE